VITVKEEFVGCDKWKRAVELAGSDSIVMWLALKRYAAANLTDGFIPDEEIERLNGAPKRPRKALDALLNCGAMKPSGSRDVGLVEQKGALGWQLHDYEDHANSATEEELRKEKARERKRRQREEKARELEALKAGQRRDMSQGQNGTIVPPNERDNSAGHVPGTERDKSQGPHAQTGARPPAPAPQRDPSPTQPNPAAEEASAAPPATPNQLSEALRMPIAERASMVLANPYQGEYLQPSQWPEVQAVGMAWSAPFGISQLRLRNTPTSDRDLTAILTAFRDGYPLEDLIRAGELAKTDEYFAEAREKRKGGPLSFSAAVLRRLLADAPAGAPAGDLGEYGNSSEWA